MKSIPYCLGVVLLFIGFFSCKSKNDDAYVPPADPLFVELPAKETGVNFINAVEDSTGYNILTYRNFYNGGGVAIGDINNDNLPDIFLTANLGQSKLYLNKGEFRFEDITPSTGILSKRGWRTGVTMADVNADGWLDIYICNSGDLKGDDKQNELYINQHDNTFKEEAAKYGLNDPGFTTHVSFFDYDQDGDLDCYILNNSFVDVTKFDVLAVRSIRDTLGGHKLMQNNNGYFTDVSEKTGIASIKIAYGLGVSVSDVNGDLYPDIYISNDFYEKDYLYINQRNGTFKDELPERIQHISSSSMGADVVDINNDGYMDIVTTDMLPEDEYRVKTMTRFEEFHVENMKFRSTFHYQYPQNTLQLNNGDGTFSETAFLSGIAATDWSWGALVFDFDNDGYRDIFISNGVYRDISDMDFSEFLANKANVAKVVKDKDRFDFRDFLPYIPSVKLPNYAYVNQRNLTFKNEAQALGLGKPSFSNGVAYGDLDNDGDFDLVVNNLNDHCFIYRNETEKKTGNHYLKIVLKGKSPNAFGIGATVNLYTKTGKQVLQNFPVRSFQSCMDPALIFGIGENERIDSLEIIWPDFARQVIVQPAVDQALTLKQTDATGKYIPATGNTLPLFTNQTESRLSGNTLHKENNYVDFDAERLIPYMLSTEGPALAVADVNGDGREDFFAGGAVDDEGKLFIQQPGGKFMYSAQPVIAKDKEPEDVAAVFFDVDNDKDADLLVASGGYQYDAGSSLLKARLYLNDGKGHFTEGQSLESISANAGCIAVYDMDKDGYTDVFIGGRAVSGNYGLPGRSFLLHNEKGKLVDVTPAILQEPGMVTDACWTDINNDGFDDLMLVGDWMPVTFYINNKGTFTTKQEIPGSTGWWNKIHSADLDKDGNMDFVLGNWGSNSRFKANKEQPMRLYINDFDGNGISECVITYYWPDGKSYLYSSKSEITSLMPSLKNRFLYFKDFAGKSVEQIFGEDVVKNARQYKTEELQTAVLWNPATGGELKPLPVMAQLAPVYAIATGDFDKDGHTDILLAGNMYDVKPDIGRLDANDGIVLKGDGKGNFDALPKKQTGLGIDGQVRNLAVVQLDNNKKAVILARNNDRLQCLVVQ